VQSAVSANTYTMQKLTMRETAERLTDAVRANLARLELQATEMRGLDT
jgi:hypothetical protein